MITASHNPPQYNGIKLFFEGREFSLEWEKEIEGKVKEGMETVSWGSAGQFSKNHGALEAYKKFILSLVDVALIKKRKRAKENFRRILFLFKFCLFGLSIYPME